eukprot:SM000384S14659  [mRNA]  locus=s384:14363:23531:- [translate_table: standard]
MLVPPFSHCADVAAASIGAEVANPKLQEAAVPHHVAPGTLGKEVPAIVAHPKIPKQALPAASEQSQGVRLRVYSQHEMHIMTGGFRQLIGEGGSGLVYKGKMEHHGRSVQVAVKRLDPRSLHGDKEWLVGLASLSATMLLRSTPSEIPLFPRHSFNCRSRPCSPHAQTEVCLGQLSHPYIVRLMGFCADKPKTLVYEFMPNGSLDEHLFLRGLPSHLTTKSDVYSFGVVLLELITGRQAFTLNAKRPSQQLLTKWVDCSMRNRVPVEKLADQCMTGQWGSEVLKATVELARQCTAQDPKLRPTMLQVCRELYKLLGLQHQGRCLHCDLAPARAPSSPAMAAAAKLPRAALGLAAAITVFALAGSALASPSSDVAALAAFRNAVAGSNDRLFDTWNTGNANACKWKGVTCNSRKLVKSLVLPNFNIGPTLSPAIGNLSALLTLDLSFNKFSGPLPATLGLLSNLRTLKLRGNEWNGSLPTQLGALHHLTTLDIAESTLTGGIPTSFAGLTSVRVLDLSGNRLSGPLPAEIGKLTQLRNLTLTQNSFTGTLPAAIGLLKRLTSIRLELNSLTGIPAEIGLTVRLVELLVPNNQLSGSIPPQLGKLKHLQKIDFTENLFSGPIPAALGGATNLRTLWLPMNDLTGAIPKELSRLSRLEFLDLSSNKLTGQVPASLGSLPHLQLLFLPFNQLASPIPPQLASRRRTLTGLRLDHNNFTGSFPTFLTSLTKLVTLRLDGNRFSGALPADIGKLAAVTGLYLGGGNSFTGVIPTSIASMKGLIALWLDHNQLTGPIPATLANLAQLERVEFSNNRLTGSIPNFKSTKFEFFRVANNTLSGAIPSFAQSLDASDFAGNPGLCGAPLPKACPK